MPTLTPPREHALGVVAKLSIVSAGVLGAVWLIAGVILAFWFIPPLADLAPDGWTEMSRTDRRGTAAGGRRSDPYHGARCLASRQPCGAVCWRRGYRHRPCHIPRRRRHYASRGHSPSLAADGHRLCHTGRHARADADPSIAGRGHGNHPDRLFRVHLCSWSAATPSTP